MASPNQLLIPRPVGLPLPVPRFNDNMTPHVNKRENQTQTSSSYWTA